MLMIRCLDSEDTILYKLAYNEFLYYEEKKLYIFEGYITEKLNEYIIDLNNKEHYMPFTQFVVAMRHRKTENAILKCRNKKDPKEWVRYSKIEDAYEKHIKIFKEKADELMTKDALHYFKKCNYL